MKTKMLMMVRLPLRRMLVILFGTLLWLIGCGDSPEMITCPDVDDRFTARVGRLPGGSLYMLGSMLIDYETDTRWKAGLTNRPPAPAVRDFFAKKGYTATVRGYIESTEVVFLDSEVDLYPMREDVEDLPGVTHALLHFLHRTTELLEPKADVIVVNGRSSPEKHAIIEVGRLGDGYLYEFGTILIRYDKYHTGAQEVNDFFSQRYYTPTITDYLPRTGYYILYIGNCVDTAPMLEPLRAIPGPEDVLLNRLHPSFDVNNEQRIW